MMAAFTWMGHAVALDGYGIPVERIGQALRAIDPAIVYEDMAARGARYPDDLRWTVQGTAVALCTPDWYPDIDADRLIGYTMFESSRLPAHWPAILNQRCSGVLVPCKWCKTLFEQNGVTVPIEVVTWGLDPAESASIARRRGPDDPYTFLWSGTPDLRKGWDVAYKAFWQAFHGDPRARLILHFRHPLAYGLPFADRNVETIVGKLERPEWRALLARADVFVFPSRGEGWGLPPREAAATGLPTIATAFGGLAEGILEWALPVPVTGAARRAEYGFWEGDIGMWPEPDVTVCAELMRYCFEQRETAAAFGTAAAKYLAKRTWADVAQEVKNAACSRGNHEASDHCPMERGRPLVNGLIGQTSRLASIETSAANVD